MSKSIESLNEQLNEWQEKLNFFKKEEAKIVDLNQKFQANKAIKEAEEKVKFLEGKITEGAITENIVELSKIEDKSNIQTLHQALDIFINHKDKLNNKTTKDEIEEIEKIKSELIHQLFGEYNQKLTDIPLLKDTSITTLFDRIFSSEKLDKVMIEDINNLRKDHKYDYYYRNVIVSSLTLSLLNFKTLDNRKLDLLIDFLTDFEKEVWQKALTGIVLAILVHQNRLERYPELIKRLQSLQNLEKVQIGIYIIDRILRNKLFESVAYPKNLLENDFLLKNPYNWFFPFYKNNKILNSALENTEQDLDIKSFTDFIYSVPFIDSFKYILCKGIEKNEIQIKPRIRDEASEDMVLFEGLDLAYALQPYYNLISEIYLYFKYFPKDRVVELFNSRTTIAQTKLKNIVLSKVQTLKVLADLHFEKKEYKESIIKLRELLNIEPNQISSLIQISESLIQLHQESEALTYALQIDKMLPKNVENLQRIGYCLNATKQFKKSLEYIQKAIEIDPKDPMLLSIQANNYFELKDYQESIFYNKKTLEIDSKYLAAVRELSSCYSKMNNPQEALKYSKQLLEFKPEDPNYLIYAASDYSEIGDMDNSEQLAIKAYDLKPNDVNIVFTYGRILFLNCKFEKAEIILNRIFNMKNSEEYHGITYGNLGHIYLFEKDTDQALELYKKCVLEFNDIKDFEEKFELDLKYALVNGIKESDYEKIKTDMVNYWQLNKI